MVRTIGVLLTGVFSVASLCAAETYDVRMFGAKGDGVAKDTVAIQKALDACAGKSGRVVLPRGTYLSGSIYVGELRLVHQELPPGERLQLRPVTTIGKLRSPRQNPRPGKSAELIPPGKPHRHLRLGDNQPFPSPSIILRGIRNHFIEPWMRPCASR